MAKTTLTPSEVANVGGREFINSLEAADIGTITTGVKSRKQYERTSQLKGLRLNVGTTGSAGLTTAVVNINGTPVTGLSVSVDNSDADGTTDFDGPDDETLINPGDIVDIEITAEPTAGSDATLTAETVEVFD